MSIRVMTSVWERSRQTGTALLLLLAIADFANDSGLAWPSIDTLAHKARCSRRHVQRLVKDMSTGEAPELKVDENAGPNGVHLYRITLPVASRTRPDATVIDGGDILSPGATSEPERGDILTRGGDIWSPQMSPKPSLTINRTVRKSSEARQPRAADSPAQRSKTERLAGHHQVLKIMAELGISDGQAQKLSLHFTPSEAQALADLARRMEPEDLGAYASQLFRDYSVQEVPS